MKKIMLTMIMTLACISTLQAGSNKFELSEKNIAKLNPEARSYYEQGQEHLDHIRKQEALEMFIKACEADPENIDMLFLVSKMELSESRKSRDMEYSYLTDDQTLSEECRAHCAQGLKYLDKSLQEEALASFKQARRLNPNHAGIQFIVNKLEEKDPDSRRSMQARRMMDRAEEHTKKIQQKKGVGASMSQINRAKGNLNIISRDKAQQQERESRRQAAGEKMTAEYLKEINESKKRRAEENKGDAEDKDSKKGKKSKKDKGDREIQF